ncbi:MAG: GDP-mannose 4,6-dehydratase [Deltaproteobacteria bacterium]|nr:GDP-mannose 4,6-dehydratase [Deltaproteobacteria bacterium]
MNIDQSKIVVTGACGFIGSHLTEALIERGCEVTALCLYNPQGSYGWLHNSPLLDHKNLRVELGDVRDFQFCKKLLKGQDAVFNLAALIGIPYSYQAPQSYIDTNITGCYNICQAAMEYGLKRVMQVSTSEVYGTARYVPIDEKHPKQPQSPYSASKISSDAIALSFFYSFDLPVTIVRPFNTYGPRQSTRAIIPTVVTQIARGSDVLELGSLSPTRDLNYVADTVNAMMAIASCDDAVGREVNIGSGREISVGDLVRMISALMNHDVEIRQDPARIRPKNSEVERLLADCSLLKQLTGFSPAFSLREGLVRTIEWFRDDRNLSAYRTGFYHV